MKLKQLNINEKKTSYVFLIVPMTLVVTMWVIFGIESMFGISFSKFGILPHNLKGFRGIFLSPFLHGSLEHIFNNTPPLFILSSILFYFYKNKAFVILFLGTFLTGFSVWLLADWFSGNGYHIGASGVVYMLASFIFFSGVFSKNKKLMVISLLMIFLYGSMIWGILPGREGVSWESHFFGFMIGLLLSRMFKNTFPKPKKFTWQNPNYIEEYEEAYWEIPEEDLPPEPVKKKTWKDIFH